jgi:hypothetical protein
VTITTVTGARIPLSLGEITIQEAAALLPWIIGALGVLIVVVALMFWRYRKAQTQLTENHIKALNEYQETLEKEVLFWRGKCIEMQKEMCAIKEDIARRYARLRERIQSFERIAAGRCKYLEIEDNAEGCKWCGHADAWARDEGRDTNGKDEYRS